MRRIASDETLLELNEAIKRALQAYLIDGIPDESSVPKIRFDVPDPNNPPDQPSVSVFLYQIQEDLEMRTGEARQYMPSTGRLLPGSVNIRCSYLITYWAAGTSTSEADQGPRSQAITTMNDVLNALANNRELRGMRNSHTRIMPPEHLNSLGQFWQALGNKPRLCLGYDVTVRLQLSANAEDETVDPVGTFDVQFSQKPPVDVLQAATTLLNRVLLDKLADEQPLDENERAQLSKLHVRCEFASDAMGRRQRSLGLQDDAYAIRATLSGVLEQSLHQRVVTIVEELSGVAPIGDVEGKAVWLESADIDGLTPLNLARR